jgi:hypothetical protein
VVSHNAAGLVSGTDCECLPVLCPVAVDGGDQRQRQPSLAFSCPRLGLLSRDVQLISATLDFKMHILLQRRDVPAA